MNTELINRLARMDPHREIRVFMVGGHVAAGYPNFQHEGLLVLRGRPHGDAGEFDPTAVISLDAIVAFSF
jgi:hypothetical protein